MACCMANHALQASASMNQRLPTLTMAANSPRRLASTKDWVFIPSSRATSWAGHISGRRRLMETGPGSRSRDTTTEAQVVAAPSDSYCRGGRKRSCLESQRPPEPSLPCPLPHFLSLETGSGRSDKPLRLRMRKCRLLGASRPALDQSPSSASWKGPPTRKRKLHAGSGGVELVKTHSDEKPSPVRWRWPHAATASPDPAARSESARKGPRFLVAGEQAYQPIRVGFNP